MEIFVCAASRMDPQIEDSILTLSSLFARVFDRPSSAVAQALLRWNWFCQEREVGSRYGAIRVTAMGFASSHYQWHMRGRGTCTATYACRRKVDCREEGEVRRGVGSTGVVARTVLNVQPSQTTVT